VGAESPNAETECLPFSSIPHTSRLFEDYLHHFDRVKRFYAREGWQRGKNSLRGGHGPEIDLASAATIDCNARPLWRSQLFHSQKQHSKLPSRTVGHPEAKLRIGAALSQAECSVVYTQYHMRELLRFFWNATRGHRLAPWRSPYLRWRMETYSGLKMDKIGFVEFWGFMVRERKQLRRFLKWTAEMDNYARPKPKNP
jgi:hypothetical protein